MKEKLYITRELVKYFKGLYPNSLPKDLNITPTELAFLQGQQSVIDHIEHMYTDEDPLIEN